MNKLHRLDFSTGEFLQTKNCVQNYLRLSWFSKYDCKTGIGFYIKTGIGINHSKGKNLESRILCTIFLALPFKRSSEKLLANTINASDFYFSHCLICTVLFQFLTIPRANLDSL